MKWMLILLALCVLIAPAQAIAITPAGTPSYHALSSGPIPAPSSPALAAPVTIEPGVTVDVTGTPLAVAPGEVVTRTTTLTNTNTSRIKGYDLGVTVLLPASTMHLALAVTGTVSGDRNGRELQMAVPADWSFVAGSLVVNGQEQEDPVIGTDGYYRLRLNLPRASTTTVVDKLEFTPPL